MVEGETDETGNRGFIADHLRHIEKSRLKGGRSTGNQCSLRMHQQRISVIFNQLYRRITDKPFVVVTLYAGCTCQYQLIIA